MADPNGPWGRKPRTNYRVYVWLGLVAAIIGSVWLLARAFPEQRLGGLAEGNLYYLITLLALISALSLAPDRMRRSAAQRLAWRAGQ